MAKTKQPQPANFEAAIAELEKILSEMERGETPLEESLGRYERGNELIRYCREVLGKAEKQIEAVQAQQRPAEQTQAGDAGDEEGDGDAV